MSSVPSVQMQADKAAAAGKAGKAGKAGGLKGAFNKEKETESEAGYKNGTKVVLEGLSDARFNGRIATVVTKLNARGRHGVRVDDNDERVSVVPSKLRLASQADAGPLADSARVLGITLRDLGLHGAAGGDDDETDEGDEGGESKAAKVKKGPARTGRLFE